MARRTAAARSKGQSHRASAAVTLTVYTILDVEYPRQGLIHLRHIDQSLIDLRDSMK
jgi:hypothetical protein